MPYTLTRRANHTVEVTAELDAQAVASERAQIVRSFRRKASVPGFRPGKAPESAIRARFGDDIDQELRSSWRASCSARSSTARRGWRRSPAPRSATPPSTMSAASAEGRDGASSPLPAAGAGGLQAPRGVARGQRPRARGRARVGRRGERLLGAGRRPGRRRRHAGRGRPAWPDRGLGSEALRGEGGHFVVGQGSVRSRSTRPCRVSGPASSGSPSAASRTTTPIRAAPARSSATPST